MSTIINLIAQYKNGQLTLDQLEVAVITLNPHPSHMVEHFWWLDDIQDMFTIMKKDISKITMYLGNGSASLLSYLEDDNHSEIDRELRQKFPANIEGSKEFNECCEEDRK